MCSLLAANFRWITSSVAPAGRKFAKHLCFCGWNAPQRYRLRFPFHGSGPRRRWPKERTQVLEKQGQKGTEGTVERTGFMIGAKWKKQNFSVLSQTVKMNFVYLIPYYDNPCDSRHRPAKVRTCIRGRAHQPSC